MSGRLRRFRAGEPFGYMTPKGLVITRAEADRLNAIAEALAARVATVATAGRLTRGPGGTLHLEPEVPETFHARLTSGSNPYAWIEVVPDGWGWADHPGGRNSTDDGTAREYNGAEGLQDKVVLMQRWPGGLHRFRQVRRGGGAGCSLTVCVQCEGVPEPGASIVVKKDGVTQASGTTGEDGCVTLDLGVGTTLPAGDWTVEASWTHETIEYDRTRTLESPCEEVFFSCEQEFFSALDACAIDSIFPGVLVEILAADGVTVLNSGTTTDFGSVLLDVGNGVSARYTAPLPRYNSPQTIPIDPVFNDVTFDPLPGFMCCRPECDAPITICDEVELIDPAGNTVTLSYQADPFAGFTHVGYQTYGFTSPVGFSDCCAPTPTNPITVRYEFNRCSGSLTALAPGYPAGGVGEFCHQDVVLFLGAGRYPWGDEPDPCPPIGCPSGVGVGIHFLAFNPTHPADRCADGVTWTYSADLAQRDGGCNQAGGGIGAETADHPFSKLVGWGTSPTCSVTTCPAPDGEGGGGMFLLEGEGGGMTLASRPARPAPAPRPALPPMREMKAAAERCPHRIKYTPAERPGCGCSHRCDAGRSPRKDGGVTVVDCWACPLRPR